MLKSYGVTQVATDQFSSAAVIDFLAKHGISARLVSMNAASKTLGYTELRGALYTGTLELYEHPDLLAELRRLRTRFSAGQSAVVNPRVGRSHGDMAQAIALALQVASVQGGSASLWCYRCDPGHDLTGPNGHPCLPPEMGPMHPTAGGLLVSGPTDVGVGSDAFRRWRRRRRGVRNESLIGRAARGRTAHELGADRVRRLGSSRRERVGAGSAWRPQASARNPTGWRLSPPGRRRHRDAGAHPRPSGARLSPHPTKGATEMLSDVKLCVANKDGSFQGCGAPLPRAGTPEAHLDHTNECSKRICPSCSRRSASTIRAVRRLGRRADGDQAEGARVRGSRRSDHAAGPDHRAARAACADRPGKGLVYREDAHEVAARVFRDWDAEQAARRASGWRS